MTREDWMVQTLEAIREDISEMKSILAVNTRELEIHIKRTDLLEKQVRALDTDVVKLRGFFTIFGWIVAVGATILTVLNQLGKL